jgi:aryl-alcohol dehydrogenase-like predicted oxidoreductase
MELRVTARLKEFAAASGHTVAQLALAWVTGHPAVSVALMGVRNEKELAENVAAVEWQLSQADRAVIDQIFVEEGVPTYVDAPQAV